MTAPPPVLGRRIVVTGLAGSGKSTLSLALAEKTGLPVIHLDLHYWKPGWTPPTDEEWRAKQRQVLAPDHWIADGNYTETLDLRMELADSVVVLDLPWWRCSGRALLRGLRMPDQLPAGCEYTRRARLRDEWLLAIRIWRAHRTEPAQERQLLEGRPPHVALHVLRSTQEVDDFLGR